MDFTPPRAPTREPFPNFDPCPCLSVATVNQIMAFFEGLPRLPPSDAVDAVLDCAQELCLAAELGLLPPEGVAHVPEIPWCCLDYTVAERVLEITCISSLPFD